MKSTELVTKFSLRESDNMPFLIKETKPINSYCLELFQKVRNGLIEPSDAYEELEKKTKWLKLYETTYEKDGKEGAWIFASRGRDKDLKPKKTPDAVIVVPILWIKPDEEFTDCEEKKLVLIKEYRVPIQDYELHFPAGLINEDVIDAAKRELEEETGFEQIPGTQIVSNTLTSSAGMADETCVIVVMDCYNSGKKQSLEETEDIEVITVGRSEIADLLRDESKKIGAKTWPILLMFTQLWDFWIGPIS